MTWIYDLADFDQIDLQDIGGKAIGLARLLRSGFAVPAAFCVRASTFDLGSKKERQHDALQLLGNSGDDCEDNPVLPFKEFNLEFTTQLKEWYRRLGGVKVAVRSSSLHEDSDTTSYAGQQLSLLNVQGDEAVCAAVVQVWNSQFAARSRQYRKRHGIEESADDLKSTMAVVVQKMIGATVAGVVFTRNPLNTSANQIVIEASWGLGESIVSGKVTPDRWVIERTDETVIERYIASKQTQVTEDGVVEVPTEFCTKACLSDKQLHELAMLAKRVESTLEFPCDIEWALADDRFWLLQSRPLSTLGVLNRDQVRAQHIDEIRLKAAPTGTVWSQFNLSEVLPFPTPMTWSIIRHLISGSGGFGLVYRDLGFDPDSALDDTGIYDLLFGRTYCNLDLEPRLYYRELPLCHSFQALKADPRKAMFPQPVFDLARADWKFWTRFPFILPRLIFKILRAQWLQSDHLNNFEKRFRFELLPQFVQDAKSALDYNFENDDARSVWERCVFWQKRTLVDFARDSLKPTALASVALNDLQRHLADKLGHDEGRQAALTLTMDVHLDAESDIVQGWKRLMSYRITEDTFLEQFGHRGPQEMELSEPRWNEKPLDLLRAGKNAPVHFIRPPEFVDDDLDFEVTWQRIASTANIPLNGLLRRKANKLRSMIRLRETAKHHFMRGYAVIRQCLCELDRRFNLNNGIFFLTTDEIPRLLEGERFEKEIISRRRRRQLEATISVPPVIYSDELENIGQMNISISAESYHGTPISPGIADGIARVIQSPAVQIPDSPYILVCPSTDPEWVPFFASASGLIMEMGGILSHGAIVAREFGIPAVSGIPGIMRMIKDAEHLQINGTTGDVQIVSDRRDTKSD